MHIETHPEVTLSEPLTTTRVTTQTVTIRAADIGNYSDLSRDQLELARKHPHPRDERIFMHEDLHRYFVQFNDDEYESKGVISASGFSAQYFTPFDKEAVSAKLVTLPAYQGRTAKEIQQEWEQAASLGTRYHLELERFFNGIPFPLDIYKLKEIQQFRKFRAMHILQAKLVPWRTEMKMYSDRQYRLVGTLDLVCVDLKELEKRLNENDCDSSRVRLPLVLFDHKFSKKIHLKSFQNKTGFGLCGDIPATNYHKYSLAMHLYRWMLETFYGNVMFRDQVFPGVDIMSMFLDVFHETHADFELYNVPLKGFVRDVFEKMLLQRKEDVREHQ